MCVELASTWDPRRATVSPGRVANGVALDVRVAVKGSVAWLDLRNAHSVVFIGARCVQFAQCLDQFVQKCFRHVGQVEREVNRSAIIVVGLLRRT